MTGDPLLLGQRVIAILEQGQRDATYKLATLMALIEHSIENLPLHAEDTLTVPIPELAHRVLALYWHQVRPFEGHDLAQRRTGTKTRIIDPRIQAKEVVEQVTRPCIPQPPLGPTTNRCGRTSATHPPLPEL